jgi:hypothetical protein
MNRIESHVLLKLEPVSERRPKSRRPRIASNARSFVRATSDTYRFRAPSQQARTVTDQVTMGFLRHWRTKRIMKLGKKKAPSRYRRQGPAVILPALAWLSLVGLHPCRAQLRFARQHPLYLKLRESVQHRKMGRQVAQNLTARNVHIEPKPAEPDHRLWRPTRGPKCTMTPQMTAANLTAAEPPLQ